MLQRSYYNMFDKFGTIWLDTYQKLYDSCYNNFSAGFIRIRDILIWETELLTMVISLCRLIARVLTDVEKNCW